MGRDWERLGETVEGGERLGIRWRETERDQRENGRNWRDTGQSRGFLERVRSDQEYSEKILGEDYVRPRTHPGEATLTQGRDCLGTCGVDMITL